MPRVPDALQAGLPHPAAAHRFTPVTTEPTVDRPHAPGYFTPEPSNDLLPWSWAVEMMNRVRNPVISTVRPDGRPHATPVWGIWLKAGYCFSTSITSVKSKNLLANSQCVITSSDHDDVVILEGEAELSDLPDGFTDSYEAKYAEHIDSGPIWVVRPRLALGFQATEAFARTATRWKFTES
jgi:hypothetical protein